MEKGTKIWLDILGYKDFKDMPDKLTKLSDVEYILLSPFIFGKYELTENDIEFIDREVLKLPLNTLSKIFNLLTKSDKTKIIPVFDLFNRTVEKTYIAIASDSQIKLKYVIYPTNMIYDLALMENELRNAQWGAIEADKGDITIHSTTLIRYHQDIYKSNLIILPKERMVPTRNLKGIEIGKYETYSKVVLIKIKDSIYFLTKNKLNLLDTMNYVNIVSILNNTEVGTKYKFIDFIKYVENAGEEPKEVKIENKNNISKILEKLNKNDNKKISKEMKNKFIEANEINSFHV